MDPNMLLVGDSYFGRSHKGLLFFGSPIACDEKLTSCFSDLRLLESMVPKALRTH